MILLNDFVWNVALVGVVSGVWRATAVKELVRLSENVTDDFSAHKVLRNLPHQVKVKESNLEQFKVVFETQEYFHHHRNMCPKPDGPGRDVWVTLRDSEASPELYFALIAGLISRPPWDKLLDEGKLLLKSGVTITLDKDPLK